MATHEHMSRYFKLFNLMKPMLKASKADDVLVVITGATIGKIAIWNYSGDYFLGGDIVKFQPNEMTYSPFVFHFLKSQPFQVEIKRNVTGATNGHLAPE